MTDEDAVPGLAPSVQRPVLFELEVEGEVFAVRRADGGQGWHYGWVSGPNPDYGFSSTSSRPEEPMDHERSIREFLSMIDPATGYLGD